MESTIYRDTVEPRVQMEGTIYRDTVLLITVLRQEIMAAGVCTGWSHYILG